MITQDMLREAGACYFDDPCSSGKCAICRHNAEALEWLGEGKTLREIALNEEIVIGDRMWVVDKFFPVEDNGCLLDELEHALPYTKSREYYLAIRLLQMGDKADQ